MQVDLVTETDKACETLVFQHLATNFPDHKVNGFILVVNAGIAV